MFSCFHAYGSIIISGQQGTIGQPFPFTVRATAYDRKDTTLFIGAHEPIVNDDDKRQAISVVSGEERAVTGITPEKIRLNNSSTEQDNPLYGKQIDFIALSSFIDDFAPKTDLFVVAHDQNTQVNLIRNYRSAVAHTVFQSSPLQAGDGVTSGIVGLAALPGQRIAEGVIARHIFFAAVRPHAGAFGPVGSGIVTGLLNVVDVGNKEEGKETTIWNYSLDQLLFTPLDVTSPALKITANLASIDNDAQGKEVVMRSYADTVYSGLFVTGGPAVGNGARSVTVSGSNAIAPDAAIENDSIIGGRTTVLNENVQVSAHFLDVLTTSTRLAYLVVVGGVGSPADTAQSVYALPLDISGALAKKTAVPQSEYVGSWQWLNARYFDDPAVAPGDLFSPSAPDVYKARVGGSVSLPGDIVALFAEKDAVFVAIGADGVNEKAGVFYSQALFDPAGAIQGWTDWQRATGSTTPTFGLAYDNKRGTFWMLPGTDANALTVLQKTAWNTFVASPFTQSLQESFAPCKTGVQGLFDFNKDNAAFSQTLGTRISALVATGYKKVVLMESGADVGVLFSPTQYITTAFEATGGSLDGFVAPAQKIEMTGGIIGSLGPIIAADIVSDGVSSWLVVGGSFGAAVLANPDGSGWPVGALEKGFVNLPSTLVWKKLGSFEQVRKIIADEGNVYILTSAELRRIAASADVFADATEQGVLLATARGLLSSFVGENGSFSDLAISGKFGLLATSAGLFRVGNGSDISQSPSSILTHWEHFSLPESSGPVTRLVVISPTGQPTDFAKDERGGNVYILNACVATAQARIYRVSIEGLVGGADISDSTIQLFQDMFVKDHVSLYLNRGDYRNYMATDGALLMMTRSTYAPGNSPQYETIQSFMEIISPTLKAGVRKAALGSMTVSAGSKDYPSYHMGPVIKRSATGSWMLGGTFLMVGE